MNTIVKYINLSLMDLPEKSVDTVVFPFFEVKDIDNSSGDAQPAKEYRFALLISPENQLARSFLYQIGFERSEKKSGFGEWSFFVCGDKGPFRTWSDKQVDSWLNILFKEDSAEDPKEYEQPTTLQLKQQLQQNEIFSENTSAGFFDIKWNFENSKFEFVYDTDKNITGLSFIINTTSLYEFKLNKLHDESIGCELLLGNSFLAGDVPTAIEINSDTILQAKNTNQNNEYAELFIEKYFSSEIKFAVKSSIGASLSFSSDFFFIRHRKDDIGIYCQESEDGISVFVNAAMSLVMAPSSASSSALALIVPLLNTGKSTHLEFNFSFFGSVLEAEPLLTFTDGAWSAANFWKEVQNGAWDVSMQWPDNKQKLILGGMDWSLADLLGEQKLEDQKKVKGVFSLRPLQISAEDDAAVSVSCSFKAGALAVPVQLEVEIGSNTLRLCLELKFDPTTFRLSTNRLDIRLPLGGNCDRLSIIDLKAFAFFLPHRFANGYFDSDSIDGSFDFEKRELVFYAPSEPDADKPVVAFPGNFKEKIDLSQRLLFEFQPFFPDYWPKETSPKEDDKKVYLRINGEGISLYAKVITAHHPNIFKGEGSSDGHPLNIVPLEKRSEEKVSEIVIINNTIRKAVLYGEFPVPATDGLLAQVEIGLRQNKKGSPPIIHAQIDLERANGKPLANLSAGYLQMQIDELRARLDWNLEKNEWKLSVPVDASFMLSKAVDQTGGLDDLKRADVLKVRNLDLLNLHKGIGEISLPISENPVKFTCLNGMFAVSLQDIRFSWNDGSVNPLDKKFIFTCEKADFAYLDPGTLQVSLEVGKVHLEFSGGNRIKMRNPERIGLDVTIGSNIRFDGEVAWVDNDKERFFAAAGKLAIAGLPEAKALLKIGTGRKANGQIVPNIVFYGAVDYEVQLFAGVVAKNFGAGIGINNRLDGIDERPNAEKLLENLDRLDPSKIENWKFVERNGFYLSIVGTTIIASTMGGETAKNVYVASLLLSVDLNLNIVAAGKVWLASSLQYVRKKENWSRPALKGAISIHKNIFTAALESCPNPAIEEESLLKKILDKGHVKLSFLLSPKVVDFFLQDISYRDNFLGVDMLYRGSLRIALFKGVVLARADQKITGHFAKTLEAGPGGFSCEGDLAVGVQFGGLFSSDGIAAYGMIAVRIMLDVDAWIIIGFSISIGWGRWKKRISFSKTFRLSSTRLEIGLLGAVAFNEKGQFGFVGELTISVCICGYRLSISPSLKINDGVIADVRNRVAVFERRLDLYRQELLNGGSGSMSDENQDNDKFWLHYQRGEWHLLVPSRDAEWFTPEKIDEPKIDEPEKFPFQNYVEAIEIDGGNIDLDMPWCSFKNEEVSQDKKDELEVIHASLLETTEEKAGSGKKTRLKDYAVVTDPRIESDSREFWLDIDQALLPDHALPIRMKSADQIIQSLPSDFGSTYGRLANYLACSQRAIIERRHSGSDLMPDEELEQRRAAFLYQMIEELKKADGQYKSPWIAQGDSSSTTKRGLIFKFEKSEIKKIKIKRENSQELQEVAVKNINSDIINKSVRLHSPRQEYVTDKVTDDRNGSKEEEGRVIVKLPLSYQDEFFHEYLPFFSHIEVWRRIRGLSGKVQIGSYQLPSIIFLPPDEKEKDKTIKGQIVVDPYIFSDHFRVRRIDGKKTIFDLGVTADATVIEYAVKIITVGEDSSNGDDLSWHPVRLHVPEPDTFPIDLGMIFDVKRFYKEESGWNPCFQLASMGDERITLALTDEWDRRQQNNNDKGENGRPFEIWAEERPIVDSGFYAGTESEEKKYPSAKSDKNLTDQEDVAVLSTEQPVIFLHDKFKVSVEVIDLSSDEEKKKYQHYPLWKISNPENIFRDGYAYRFYIRPIFIGTSAKTKAVAGALRPLDLMLSKSIPFSIPIKGDKDKDIPDILTNFPVSPDEIYVWYETGKDGVKIPAVPKGRAVRQIEWIGIKNKQFLTDKDTPEELIPAVSVRPLEDRDQDTPEKLRRQIGISWNFSGAAWGGVEFQIADKDDSAVAARFVCEVQEYSSFQHSIHNFANDSAWRLTNQERLSRLNCNSEVATFENVAIDDVDIVNQTLFLDNEANSLLKNLEEAGNTVKNIGNHWSIFASNATKFIKNLRKYQQSPINLNDKIFQAAILKTEALIRYLFIGIELKEEQKKQIVLDYNNPDILKKITDQIKAIDSDLEKQLKNIDELKLHDDQFDDTASGREKAKLAVLDRDCSRKLAAIIRRRMAIGEDVLAGAGDNLPLSATDNKKYWLPRGEVFPKTSNGKFLYTNKLLQFFPELPKDDDEDAYKNPPDSEQLNKSITELLNLSKYHKINNDSEPDDIRKKDVASIVTRSAGLTAALGCLEEKLPENVNATTNDKPYYYIDKRPHHVISVVKDSDGKRVPEQIEMKKLLPDSHRDLSVLGLDENETASSSEADLAAYFNLLERMGFAVDLAGADENGEPLTQQELIRYIKEKLVENVEFQNFLKDEKSHHYIYLITPREPDSEYRGGYPDDERDNYFYVGFSFVKLAVIPKAFHYYLCSLSVENNEKKIIEWFSIRGIKDVTLDHLRVFAKAAHFASWTLTKENASKDFHFHHIRMTPLQLHHISVPHVKGFAHINWQVPDQLGHRFVVSARPMSRYEPFIRWAEETPPPRLAPANSSKGTEVHVHRIIVAKEGSTDVPASLPVSIFPHPEHLRFGYALPPAGVRSLLNRISLVRTGYKGCQLIFRHHLIDQEEGKPNWCKIITNMAPDQGGENVNLSKLVTVPTTRNISSDVRLFRNERLISLEEIPYYYGVKLSVISKFEGDLKGNKKQEEVSSLYAQRMPTVIAYRLPEITRVKDSAGIYTYTIEIVLTRLAEMASYAELHSGIPEQKEDGIQDWPVPFLGYHFYYWIQSGKSEEPDSDSIYQSVIELLMPWHEGYKSPDASKSDKLSGRPFVRKFDSEITVTEPYPEIQLQEIGKGKYFPVVKFEFTTGENKLLFKEQKRRYMQVSCYGKLTPATFIPPQSEE